MLFRSPAAGRCRGPLQFRIAIAKSVNLLCLLPSPQLVRPLPSFPFASAGRPIMLVIGARFAGSRRASSVNAPDIVEHRDSKCRPCSPCGLDAGAGAFCCKRDCGFAMLDFSPRCSTTVGRSQSRVGGLCLAGAIIRSRGWPENLPTDPARQPGTSSRARNGRRRYDRDYRNRILSPSQHESSCSSQDCCAIISKDISDYLNL